MDLNGFFDGNPPSGTKAVVGGWMYAEADYLPLSGLQHLCFCERQCALIHLEGVWSENFLTASGRVEHGKVHGGAAESRRGVRTERDLQVSSARLGVAGRTDAVEFRRDGSVVPVEYKHGSPKDGDCDSVQLCAQAICLEEMLGVEIAFGELFYFGTRRRVKVPLTDALRAETAALAERFHALVDGGKTPPAGRARRCAACSLSEECLPKSAGRGKSAAGYLAGALSSGDGFSGE